MDEDAEIQSLTALLADEEPRVLKAIEDNRKLLATARRSLTRLKKSQAKNKAEARETAKARVFELEGPLRDQEALVEKRKHLLALESNRARRIRAQEVVRGREHNARVPTFLKLPRNVLDNILYSAMLRTQESEGSCLCSHTNKWSIRSRHQEPWEVRVMNVCKALHDHVVASPAMWTFISMTVSESSRAIQMYISRSGCRKLHVSLKVCSDQIEDLSGYDPRFALLARHIHRIQVLCLLCDGYKALNVATIPFHRLTAPSLVRLHLSFDIEEDQLFQQEENFNVPTISDDDDSSSEFPLLDAKGAAALERGTVLVAKAPVLSTVSIDDGYFAKDLPFLAQVKTFCLTHGVSYVPDMEIDDVQYLGNSEALRNSIQQLVVARDAFGYGGYEQSEPDGGEQEDDEQKDDEKEDEDEEKKESVLRLPSLRSVFLLPPVRGTYDDLYQQPLLALNVLDSIAAPDLSNLGFFHDEERESDSDDDESDDGHTMSVPDLLRRLPSRRPKFPQLKRLVAIRSGGLARRVKPKLKVRPDTSRAVECRYGPFPDLEELMLVDDVRMGLIEGILGYKDCPDKPEPCRYPKLTGLTLAVHRKKNLQIDLARLEKLLCARRDAGAPLKSVRFVGHALPKSEEEEAESQKICQQIRDLGVEDVRMHHGSAMLYLFLEKMFSEELVCHLKGLS